MSPYDPQQTTTAAESKSIFGVIVHSFFVVPFLIAVFCVLVFVGVRILTCEKQTAFDLLEDIKSGGSTKRWQAAFELSRLLSNPKSIPSDDRFYSELIHAFNHSLTDDPRVRQFLSLAMGQTQKEEMIDPLMKTLRIEKGESLQSIIYALGLLKAKKASMVLVDFLSDEDSRIRLTTVMTLGQIADLRTINFLKKALNDQEPNVQWETALTLAKMKDLSGRGILLKLLDRQFFAKFPLVDSQEQTHILSTVINVVGPLNDSEFKGILKTLAASDPNMQVRKLAMAYSQ